MTFSQLTDDIKAFLLTTSAFNDDGDVDGGHNDKLLEAKLSLLLILQIYPQYEYLVVGGGQFGSLKRQYKMLDAR